MTFKAKTCLILVLVPSRPDSHCNPRGEGHLRSPDATLAKAEGGGVVAARSQSLLGPGKCKDKKSLISNNMTPTVHLTRIAWWYNNNAPTEVSPLTQLTYEMAFHNMALKNLFNTFWSTLAGCQLMMKGPHSFFSAKSKNDIPTNVIECLQYTE